MNRLLTTLILLAITSTIASAQLLFQIKRSTQSDVDFYATNYGVFGLDVNGNRAGFQAPRGSNNYYIFGAGLWFAAKKDVSGTMNKLVFITYNPNSGKSWGTPGEGDATGANPNLFISTEYIHTTGVPVDSGSIETGATSWPLWLRAGQTARPDIPGEFVPMQADRTIGSDFVSPAFMPHVDEQFVSRFHDGDLGRYDEMYPKDAAAIGYPIGLQVQQNIYGWNAGPFRDVVILQYEFTNTSLDILHDCSIAQMTDMDIGIPSNDNTSFYAAKPELRTALAWSGPESRAYGTLATVLLEGPVVDSYGFIDNTHRASYLQDGRVGSVPDWPIENDPGGSKDRYDFMTSSQISGATGSGDRRALLATTPFNMHPGDVAHFTIAYAVVDGTPGITRPIDGDPEHGVAASAGFDQRLEELVSQLIDDYYIRQQFTAAVPVARQTTLTTLSAAPNPTASESAIGFTISERSQVTLRVVNSLGQTVLVRPQGVMNAGRYTDWVDVSALPAGVYFVAIESGASIQTTRLVVSR